MITAIKKNNDLYAILSLFIIFVILYFPIWNTNYLYTDEAVQLWFYGKQPGYQMFFQQGRYITEKLMQWLFGSAQSIDDVRYIRLFSFVGWMITIPIWYYILKNIFVKEGLPVLLAFFSVLFLICCPPFTISVVWASCVELFLANTSGLVSGYFAYRAIKFFNDGRRKGSVVYLCVSILFGVISLFTYQNGFGCFFLPFIIHLFSAKRNMRYLMMGVGTYILILIIYFLSFKYSLWIAGIASSDRTSLHIAPWEKLKFFIIRPMSSGFHLTYLFNEKNIFGYVIYVLLASGWAVLYWLRNKNKSIKDKLAIYVTLFLLFAFIYLPSLLVKENYASNRTLLALDMAIFILIAESVFFYFKNEKFKNIILPALAILFICNAWHNTRYLFIKPVQHEYVQLRSFLEKTYNPAIQSFYFIRPEEDFFVHQYGITRSWDEFGVPSSFFNWVPEFFTRQVIFEITGSRSAAEKIVIKHWLGEKEFNNAAEKILPGTLIIDAEEIIKGETK
ncbi:MAG TPA: hypothetical protein VIQ00_16975 [Chitinophagaceae bacterium]